jgi:aryl-alcohol dehydrogenase-like predicted oxidoreductase
MCEHQDFNRINSLAPHKAGVITRRDFIRSTVAAGVVLSASFPMEAADTSSTIPQRALGRTGLKISCIGLGGYHIGSIPEESQSVRLIRSAIDQGITFMDNCWDYHNGKSEEWMGKALRDGYRDKVVLMSKIDGQTKEAAARQIDESLKRLQTDHVDLMQFHEVIRQDDPEKILGPGGAMEAMLAAKRAGKVRFIGFTGHKDPKFHLKMLEMSKARGSRIDAVQMPLNLMDTHHKSFEKEVLPVLIREQIGVLAMKTIGSGHLLRSGAVTARECLRYALSLPVSTVITGIEKQEILEQAISVAQEFKPFTSEEMAALRQKTAPLASEGKFEPFKHTTDFDGTVKNPQWLG